MAVSATVPERDRSECVEPPEARPLSTQPSRMCASRRVVLLGAGFSTQNLGVWALASSAVGCVLACFPKARVRFLDYDREPATYRVRHAGRHSQVELLNIRFSKKVLLPNNIARLLLVALGLRLLPSKRLRQRMIGQNPFLNAIAEADLVGSIAGGDSFSDVYGLSRLLYVSLPQILVLALGKPLVLLPQTVGPFRSAWGGFVARQILRRAATVFTRDRESLGEVERLVGTRDSRFRIAYDMAFALEPVAPPEERLRWLRDLEQSGPLVGLNVSGLLWMGGYNRRNMFGLKMDYVELIRKIIRSFVDNRVRVVLVPHVLGAGPDSESDTQASAMIHKELACECSGRLHLLRDGYDHQEIKYMIGRCDFFLGSRMHACIAAVSQGVPAVGLAYSRKFKGVMETIGAEDLVIDLTECDAIDVLKRIEAIYKRRQQIREQLERKIPEVRSSVLGLLTQHLPAQAAAGGAESSREPAVAV